MPLLLWPWLLMSLDALNTPVHAVQQCCPTPASVAAAAAAVAP
jgi:hypothetical protein